MIGHVITLGIGTPSDILHLMTFGLSIGDSLEVVPGDRVTTANAYFRRSVSTHDGAFARGVTVQDAPFRRAVTTRDSER